MVKYSQLPKVKKTHLIILIAVFLLLDLVFVWLFKPANIGGAFDLSFSTPNEFNNFTPVQFNYSIKSKKDTTALSKLLLCDVDNKNCVIYWQKSLKVKAGINNGRDEFVINTQGGVGDRNLIFSLENSQKYQSVSVKNIADLLYLNLEVNRDIVVSGDYAKLNYLFINRSDQSLFKKNFSLSLNFAGPFEKSQNTGRQIENISQDIAPSQTISGQSTFVANEYLNREGGLFDLSLYLSFKDRDGKLIPVVSVVKQIRWL